MENPIAAPINDIIGCCQTLLEGKHGELTSAQRQDVQDMMGSARQLLTLMDKVARTDIERQELSYKLLTPLNVIIGFSQVLQFETEGPLSEEQKAYLKQIHKHGRHVLRWVNDVVDPAPTFVRAKGPLDQYVDLKDLVEKVRPGIATLLKNKPVELRVELEENLPNAYGDELHLWRIFVNVISHAVQLLQQGEISVRARLNTQDAKAQRIIEVIIAIQGTTAAPQPSEERGEVRTDTRLGLSLAKAMIEKLGGTTRFDTPPGTTFYFTLPTGPTQVVS